MRMGRPSSYAWDDPHHTHGTGNSIYIGQPVRSIGTAFIIRMGRATPYYGMTHSIRIAQLVRSIHPDDRMIR
jgi:hypothetical protein